MIVSADYATISFYLGELYSLGTICISFLDAMPDIIDTIDTSAVVSEAGQVRASIVSTTTLIENNHVDLDPSLQSTTIALQTAITLGSGSVDAYLVSESLQVSSDFAALSAACGFSIDPSNVES
jgi:hypothetical protein